MQLFNVTLPPSFREYAKGGAGELVGKYVYFLNDRAVEKAADNGLTELEYASDAFGIGAKVVGVDGHDAILVQDDATWDRYGDKIVPEPRRVCLPEILAVA